MLTQSGTGVTKLSGAQHPKVELEAIADLSDTGLRTVVVTNQRGVARGVVSEHVLHEIHRQMRAEIGA
jgi:histidinol phosphatase-like enzyme